MEVLAMVQLLVMVRNKEDCGHGWLMFMQGEIKIFRGEQLKELSGQVGGWQRSSGLEEKTS